MVTSDRVLVFDTAKADKVQKIERKWRYEEIKPEKTPKSHFFISSIKDRKKYKITTLASCESGIIQFLEVSLELKNLPSL